jgi:hypothetical protein
VTLPDRRYFVTLTATCGSGDLHAVVEHLSTQLAPIVEAIPNVEGVSLSFTRDDAESFSSETVALPVAGPVVSTGPGAPPPDAVNADDGQHAAPEEQP